VCVPHDNINVTHMALGGPSVWHACSIKWCSHYQLSYKVLTAPTSLFLLPEYFMYFLRAFLYCDSVAILWISTQSLIHSLHISYSNGFRWGNIFTAICCQLYKCEYDFWHWHDGSPSMHSSCILLGFCKQMASRNIAILCCAGVRLYGDNLGQAYTHR